MNYTDFNTLSKEQLQQLDGIGRSTASRIIAARPFTSNQELKQVKGLGSRTLAKHGVSVTNTQAMSLREKNLLDWVIQRSKNKITEPHISEWTHNRKVLFAEDITKNTCHRPDLVTDGCNDCVYACVCGCRLKGFKFKNKRVESLTETQLSEIVSKSNYKYINIATNEIDLSRININVT
jgi:ribosomal protein S13